MIVKFKGKTFEDIWVYGYLVHDFFYTYSTDNWIIMTQNIDYEVQPDTIGQFTNHYDQYGNEIYGGLDNNGGDIVKTISSDLFDMDKIEHIKEIAWAPKGGWHPISTYCENLEEFLKNIHGKNISEVIGNKTDNPELLK